jgi:hypothetical protein
MDQDDKGYFAATAMALAATQMVERILEDWKRRQPEEFASFAAKSIEDLERVLEQTRAAADDAPFSRQALFRHAASVQLDLVRPLVRKASRTEGRPPSDRRREPDDVA